jgi:hypothetical protein
MHLQGHACAGLVFGDTRCIGVVNNSYGQWLVEVTGSSAIASHSCGCRRHHEGLQQQHLGLQKETRIDTTATIDADDYRTAS